MPLRRATDPLLPTRRATPFRFEWPTTRLAVDARRIAFFQPLHEVRDELLGETAAMASAPLLNGMSRMVSMPRIKRDRRLAKIEKVLRHKGKHLGAVGVPTEISRPTREPFIVEVFPQR